MTPADLLKAQRIAKAGKKVTSGLSAAKEAQVIANMERAGEMPLTAADLYQPGVHYADPLKPPTMKMSEALGASGSEGKTLRFTEADRSRVFGPNRGGVGFSGLQHYSEPHKKARAVWGYGNESTARKKINQGGPESTVWTTYAGSPTQHKSNTVVVKDAIKTLQEANKEGAVHPEQIRLINYRLQQAIGDNGKPLFPEGFDITDPKALSYATTFDRRAILSDTLMGVGVKKPMKSVEFKKANPGVVWTDASNIENILARETEPALKSANTFDVGPHLFDIEDNIIVRPDLNEAFPFQVTGTDYGLRYEPTPFRVAAPTFTKDIPMDEAINAWKMSRGSPSEFISEEYLTNLQKEGYADGGLAHMAAGGTPSQQFPLQKTAPAQRKPISALIPLTDAAAAVQEAYNAEKGTYGEKGAGMDILNRGFVSDVLGGAVDLANLPLQGLDYLASKIPALSKPASVMDPEGERVAAAPLAVDEPFAGKEAWNKLFQKSGITSKTERPIAEMATSLLAPFAPAAAGKAAKLAVKGAKAAAPTAGRLAQEFAEQTQFGMPLQMNVVKPKGGNWLAGSTEKLTEPMKRNAFIDVPQLQEPVDAAVNKWIDQKLGKYVKNEMGTPEDPIRLGIERRAAEAEKLREANEARLAKMEADIAKAKAAGKDTTLSENDLEAAREKFGEEYQIASRGLYHGTVPEAGWNMENIWEPEALGHARKRAGFPEEGMATHPASKTWEQASDVEINSNTVENLNLPAQANREIQEANPWLSKLDPQTKVYKLDDAYPDVNLEFRHMIDEVKNAMDPTSNLPKNLRIAPKDLEKMTVDDVSSLAGRISAWRDVQKVKADLKTANNPAVHMFKEYPPENNPKGVAWKQIKRPEGLSDEEAEKFVRDATKYEGDVMRHCVGGAGHCEPLLRGDVELYTLRDAKGEPHVTIEVEPTKVGLNEFRNVGGEYYAARNEAMKRMGLDPEANISKMKDANKIATELDKQMHNIYVEQFGEPPKRILEIKGKNNQKPKDEYIPFVQDFVKSGNFKTVGDSANADMYQPNPKTLAVFKPDRPEIADLSFKERFDIFEKAKEAGELNSYLTRDDWENILLKYATGKGFAKGGAVSSLEDRMNKMLADHHYAKGGAVDSLEDRMNAMLAAHHAPQRMAEGGSPYNTNPDMADGGAYIQAGQFKIGGRIALIKH